MEEQTGRPGRWSGSDTLACLGCIAISLTLAIEPHLTTLVRDGTLEYVGDGDDAIQMAVARMPYHGEAGLRDPFLARWQRAPSVYPWFLFAPMAHLTRALGLAPVLMALVWRVGGGVLFGLALYVLFRRLLAGTGRPTAWALGCTLVCLADAGFIFGRVLVQDVGLVGHMLRGTTPLTKPDGLPQFRVMSPLVTLPPLLLMVACLAPRVPRGGWAPPLGAVFLGACFHVYFFMWTAAVAGLGAYVAACWAASRRAPGSEAGWGSQARAGAIVLVGGLLIGAPQVAANARLRGQTEYRPVLRRLCRGMELPPGHPCRTRYLRNFWAWGKLAVGAIGIAALRAWGLALLWWLTLAGFALANGAIVTGLEFENWHWSYVYSPTSEVLLLALAALALDRLGAARRRLLGFLWAAPVALVAVALVWRPYEAMTAPEAVAGRRALRETRPLRPALAKLGPDDVLAGPFEAGVALLSTRAGLLYQYDNTAAASMISDREAIERHALNGWLRGLDAPDYAETAGAPFAVCHCSPPIVPSWEPDAVAAARRRAFATIRDGGEAAMMGRYRPDALLTPATAPEPTRGGPWRRAAEGPVWTLWVR